MQSTVNTSNIKMTSKGILDIFNLTIEANGEKIKDIILNDTMSGKVTSNIVEELKYLIDEIEEHNSKIDEK